MKSFSLAEKVKALAEKRKKLDMGIWANGFVASVVALLERYHGDTQILTEKQAEKVDQLWEKHCNE